MIMLMLIMLMMIMLMMIMLMMIMLMMMLVMVSLGLGRGVILSEDSCCQEKQQRQVNLHLKVGSFKFFGFYFGQQENQHQQKETNFRECHFSNAMLQ